MIDTTMYPSPGIAQQGWQCPVCKTVHAPWISQCYCQAMPTWTVGDPIYSPGIKKDQQYKYSNSTSERY